ncbi:MAG TPA: hypothetical protein PKH32_04700, partial [Verrucomicrobiota bacterium]|nr:hypothetical protein [Verrucomicrobiota bacterium]
KRPSAEILPKVAARLIQVVRECDDSRPITAALANIRASNATGLADLLDVVGYNYQVADYERDFATYPQRKFLGSETSQALNAYEISQHPRVAGQFLWVGWDFLGEGSAWPARGSTSGVFDTCGFLKPRAYIREALWSEKPAVRIAVRGPGGGRRGGGGRFAPLENHWNWQNDTRTNLPVKSIRTATQSSCSSTGDRLAERRSRKPPIPRSTGPFPSNPANSRPSPPAGSSPSHARSSPPELPRASN